MTGLRPTPPDPDAARVSGAEPPREVTQWLDEIRIRAASVITRWVCEQWPKCEEAPDPADVHEDVREDLLPFFDEIAVRLSGAEPPQEVESGQRESNPHGSRGGVAASVVTPATSEGVTPQRCSRFAPHAAHIWDSGFATPYWCPGAVGAEPPPAPSEPVEQADEATDSLSSAQSETGSLSAVPAQAAAAEALRCYLVQCSMPLQGPLSGALYWVTADEALAALDALLARVVEAEREAELAPMRLDVLEARTQRAEAEAERLRGEIEVAIEGAEAVAQGCGLATARSVVVMLRAALAGGDAA